MADVARAATRGARRRPSRTPKLTPPAPPAALLPRARLRSLLDGALERRLTSVVAEAGYGKSTFLAALAADRHCAWYGCTVEDRSLATFARGLVDAIRLRAPTLPLDVVGAVTGAGPGVERDELSRARGLAALVCEALHEQLNRDLLLVLDDVHELDASVGSLHLIDSLCRQAPERLHLVLASRTELPFPVERLRGQGQVLEVTGADLAFDVDETHDLLRALTGMDDARSAEQLHRATGGWPAAVRLAIETLRDVPPGDLGSALERIRRPGGTLFAYLAAEVFAHEPPEVEALVRTVAPLERFTPELCEALGAPRAGEVLDALARRGLFVELHGRGDAWYTLGEPVREYALARFGPSDAERHDLLLRAAGWLEEHDHVEDALRCSTAADDLDGVARLLAHNGHALLAHGSVDAVLAAVAPLPLELRSPRIEQIAGEAFQIHGDRDEALRCFERAAEGAGPLPPALAWRIGLLHHLAGHLDAAIDTYERSTGDGEPRDVALVLAWRASALWLRGDADRCREDAEHAFRVASEAGDAQALAAAHTVLAMLAALEGDRAANDAHYLRALDCAQQAGDVLQLIRIRTNRGSRHVEEGGYEEAIVELDLALRLADVAGFTAFRALALTNRGEARAKLGRFEEAVADLEDARELYQRLGSRMIAYPLDKLGEIHRERGELALARASYEEALARAEPSGDLQGLVPALVGLARVLMVDEPDEAERLVARALEAGPGMGHAAALLGAGWVALAAGRRDDASVRAREAAAAAGLRRDRAALAESLELRALASREPLRELERVTEAAAIWRDLRNPLGEARAELVAAAIAGNEDAAADAEERLTALGARGYRSALSLALAVDESPAVLVRSLGRFQVLLRGEPVPLAAWQSRKARDLLKILVARRGRPTPRDLLMETLWPGQDPIPLGNRLSVLLSTVRSVLDPGKRHDADRFVRADKSAVWLDYAEVVVDVDRFLVAATHALDLRAAGGDESFSRLAAAEAAYAGDFLEEDAYEDWAVAVREEARAAYVEVARALAEDAAVLAKADSATRYYLRVLERDSYDEPAHLGLVETLYSGGRHGEARRAYRAYCARMDSIGVESAPFPGPP